MWTDFLVKDKNCGGQLEVREGREVRQVRVAVKYVW